MLCTSFKLQNVSGVNREGSLGARNGMTGTITSGQSRASFPASSPLIKNLREVMYSRVFADRFSCLNSLFLSDKVKLASGMPLKIFG
jgi:hypothetical protein